MENWTETAVNVTICGLVIVFVTLILLVILISLFGKLMDAINKKSQAAKAAAIPAASAAPVASAAPAVTAAPASDDDELIAVISAAVAVMYDGTGKQYAVKSVRPARRPGERPAWASAGLRDNTRTF